MRSSTVTHTHGINGKDSDKNWKSTKQISEKTNRELVFGGCLPKAHHDTMNESCTIDFIFGFVLFVILGIF